MQENKIVIEKVSEHNLKEVSVEIPHNKLTVITGVSGSGKSSLAFNTIFQEGQRLYISSLSSYARQYLQNYDKPKVEKIEGLSPTISIDQKTVGRSNRSTVGTVTGIYDFLRLMFARLGNAYCPNGHGLLEGQSKESIEQHISYQFKNKKVLILAPAVLQKKGTYRKELELYKEQGFRRALINNELKKLDEKITLNRYEKHNIELVIDLMTLEESTKPRLLDAISKAIEVGDGRVSVLDYDVLEEKKSKIFSDKEYELYTINNSCAICGASALEIEPTLFSFNLPIGQCKTCLGVGVEYYFEEKSLISDPSKPFQKAIDVLNDKGNLPYIGIGNREIRKILKKHKVNATTAWEKIPLKVRSEILNGSEEFEGIIPILREMYFRYRLPMLKKYLEERICSSCNGDKLSPIAKSIKVLDKDITQYNRMTVTEMVEEIEKLNFEDEFKSLIFQPIYKEISERLKFLMHVGLEYLTFDRSANSLSGGEAQRIRLAAQIGSGLEGCMYILDEPSIGLHQSDNRKLIETLRLLRDKNNTVIIIEHDEETMLCSDHLIDIGKFAGVKGGHLVFSDEPSKIFDVKKDVSITGDYLLGRKNIFFEKQKKKIENFVEIKGVNKNNIQKKNFKIPLDCFVAIAGVSGSGKSTFLEIFTDAVKSHLSKNNIEKVNKNYSEILGLDKVKRIVEIDQKSIGRTSRSNPATYTKVWDLIRDLYTAQKESKILGYQKGRFSFNVKGGRCEECGGSGVQKIEMEIFADVEIICDTCNGKRFNEATLRIHYNHKSIYDVLEMTIEEAALFFEKQKSIQDILQTMLDVGLGYLKLGQNSTTLSGGEAQRIKLSRELSKNKIKGALYILDEPTTGLHLYDIDLLLKTLYRLIEKGNSVIVIEHNMDVLKVADHLIEMGPSAGKDGGKIIANCSPLELTKKNTPTGIELKKFFVREQQRQKKAFLKKTNFQSLLKEFNNNISFQENKHSLQKKITIRGLRKNNLKSIDVEIIKNTITVVTGPSGSGKTSFAFGSLFQEGQRKYLESMSSYARRFVEKADKVDADEIVGIAPTIAINQKHSHGNPRSIVATQTEIYDTLRVLYATIGRNKCPICSEELQSFSIDESYDFLIKNYLDQKIIFAIPVYKDWTLEEETIWQNKHFKQYDFSGEEIEVNFLLQDYKQFEKYIELFQSKNIVRVMIDGKIHRLENVTKKDLVDVKTIFLVLDKLTINQENKKQILENIEKAYLFGDQNSVIIIDEKNTPLLLSKNRHCGNDFYFLRENLNSKYFSFNHPLGSCETCEGLGEIGKEVCKSCNGGRLKRDALLTVIGRDDQEYSIADLTRKDIFYLLNYLEKLIQNLSSTEKKIAKNIIQDVLFRLKQLDLLGLGYISLNRKISTLSGGEVQRIKLSTQIGNRLQDVIFVLDEPTIGLHEVEIEKLFLAVKRLKDLGNTIVAVEHDSTFIKKSDEIIDIGPEAGEQGGNVLYNGENKKTKIKNTSIYPYLYGDKLHKKYRKILSFDDEKDKSFTCTEVTTNNIDKEDFTLPINRLTALTGVSGSGKSSLFGWIKKRRFSQNKTKNNFNVIFESVKFVDQSAVAASIRSTPITYLGLFDEIRLLFANTKHSRERGYTASYFSFNSNRTDNTCYECNGIGQQKIEMHFISDIKTVCPACQGKRFQRSVLEVFYNGKNIHDVLEMTFEEAHAFFKASKRIPKKLQFLLDAGLGYLKLGLSMDVLSGGELQRLKIAKELMTTTNKNCLYLLDEPTTGLHFSDVEKLVIVLDKLVQAGNTILVIEHNIEFLRNCDYFIDMGPGAGKDGGKIVNFGSLEEMKKKAMGDTYRYL